MTVNQIILKEYPSLNKAQRSIIDHDLGPLLVISGGLQENHSASFFARSIYFSRKKRNPKELIICTFTEKAAYELRDRISAAAMKVGYHGDLSELRVSTIHGLCNTILGLFRHRTPIGNNYEVLDELTQLLFIFENFDLIVRKDANEKYLGRWIHEMVGYQIYSELFQ